MREENVPFIFLALWVALIPVERVHQEGCVCVHFLLCDGPEGLAVR